MLTKVKIIICFVTFVFGINTYAAILGNAEAREADLSLLKNETAVFKSIGMSIALSLAQCEGISDLCTLNVEEDELKELINALETRINSLELRQEETDNPEELEQVLTAYINSRDNYNSHLEQLKNISSTLDEEADLLEESAEPDISVDEARSQELLEYVNELELYEDEELEDDAGVDDLPPLPPIDETDSTP